jgi:hypothetical protein
MPCSPSPRQNREEADFAWDIIGVRRYAQPVRFSECGHQGTLGTRSRLWCADCWIVERQRLQRIADALRDGGR